MGRSSFHGVIEEIPGVFADNFECLSTVEPRAFFLSHCHTDHTQGLLGPTILDVLNRTKAKIYMSAETAAVIETETNSKDLMQYIEVLKLGTTPITLPEIPEKDLEQVLFDVSVIPAGHCFGSVMYLFKTNTKNVLFTGDFRISCNDVSKYAHFHGQNGDPIVIDTMYVDTTFLKSRYTYFPKRSDSVGSITEEITKWLCKDNRRVALHTSAKYGYEFVYNQIFTCLKKKVYVNESQWKLYCKFTKTIPGVTDSPEETPIHICRNRSEFHSHTECVPNADSYEYLYVHFSALKWHFLDLDDDSIHKVSDNRIDVCFPTHCSSSEVKHFIRYFSPKKVVGFPEDYKETGTKMETADVLKESLKRKLVSPVKTDLKCGKVDNGLLKKIFNF